MTTIQAKIQAGEQLTEQELKSVTTMVEMELFKSKESDPERYLELLKELNQIFENK